MRPPSPNSPHFPLRQNSMRDLSTIATTAVVKKVLHRRALRHLNIKDVRTLKERKKTILGVVVNFFNVFIKYMVRSNSRPHLEVGVAGHS